MNKAERLGTCQMCYKQGIIERHHVSYFPERTINLCHKCHFKVHYQPGLLTRSDLIALLNAKLNGKQLAEAYKTEENLNKFLASLSRSLSLGEKAREFMKEFAPSRKEEGFGRGVRASAFAETENEGSGRGGRGGGEGKEGERGVT
jgi:hypothetical protein